MTGKKRVAKATRIDPGEAPELTDDWFAKADLYQGQKLVRRGGRPKTAAPKEAVNIRLDPDLLAHFRRYWSRLAVAHQRGAAEGCRADLRRNVA